MEDRNVSQMPMGSKNNVHSSASWLSVEDSERSESKVSTPMSGETERPRSEEMPASGGY